MTSYQLTPRLQFFGGIENLTNTRYYNYGTFSPTGLDGGVYVAQAPSYTTRAATASASRSAAMPALNFTF